MSREDIVTALLAAATRLGPVSLRLRGRAWPAVADELDQLAAGLARAARGQTDAIATAARAVDLLRARSTFLRIRAQAFAAAELMSILRDLASVADAELPDTQVGVPVVTDDEPDTETLVIDDPAAAPKNTR